MSELKMEELNDTNNTHESDSYPFKPNVQYQQTKAQIVKFAKLDNNSFLNRIMKNLAETACVFHVDRDANMKSINGHQMMKSFVNEILQHGMDKFKVPVSAIKDCGGFTELPHKPNTSDCDYNVVLDLPAEYISFQHKCSPQFYALDRVKKSRYFKGKFTDAAKRDPAFLEKWRCREDNCNHAEKTLDCEHALDASIIQKQFLESIWDGLVQTLQLTADAQAPNEKCCFISGPAVTIALEIKNHTEYNLANYVTIDLALAIQTEIECKQCLTVQELNESSPRLVPSGNFWRTSFSERETELITNCTDTAKAIYAAAKGIRDEVAPTLSTYPIKQAFLCQRSNIEYMIEHTEDKFWILSKCTNLVFDYMTESTEKGEFYNYHQGDDPVMEIADANYIKSKSLKQYLLEEDRWYRIKGRFHLGYMSLFLLYSLIDFLRFEPGIYFFGHYDLIKFGLHFETTFYTFLFLVLVRCLKFHLVGKFEEFYGLGLQINLLVCAAFTLIYGTINMELDTDNARLICKIMSGFVIVYVISNLVIYAIFSGKHMFKYSYECVLTQQIWSTCFTKVKDSITHTQYEDTSEEREMEETYNHTFFQNKFKLNHGYISPSKPREDNRKLDNSSFICRVFVFYAREAGLFNTMQITPSFEERRRIVETFVHTMLQYGNDKFRVGMSDLIGCGPVVTIALELQTTQELNLDKYFTIDLALAVPAEIDCTIPGCDISSHLANTSQKLVPAGDFWTLSFSANETEILRNCSETELAVYAAAMGIGNHVLPYISKYPIKQAFLHTLDDQRQHVETENTFWDLKKSVVRVFDYMTNSAAEDKFYNFHLRNDPVMEASDDIYIQSKQCKQYLLDQNLWYRNKGIFHIVCVTTFLVLNLAILTEAVLDKPTGNFISHPFTIISVIVVSSVMFLTALFLVNVAIPKLYIYGMFGRLYGYGIVSSLLLYSTVTLLSSVITYHHYLLERSRSMTIIMSSFVILHMLCNLILYMIYSRKYRVLYFFECVLTQQFWLRFLSKKREYFVQEDESTRV